jgi:hypothetical protein
MICPRCNTRNELGAADCAHCGAPFTHQSARRIRSDQRGLRHDYRYHAPPSDEPPRPRSAPRPRRVYRRSTGPGNRAIGGLMALLIITIVVISGAALLGSGDNASRLSNGVSESISGLVGFGGDDGVPDVEVPEAPPAPLGDQTWTLSQDELNQRLSQNPDAFSPAQDVVVELGEGTVTVRFRAYGMNGTYHGSLTTRNGVPVVADSTIDGAIGWVVGSSRIDDVLNQQMAAVVEEQNVSVESVHVRPGEMVFGIS